MFTAITEFTVAPQRRESFEQGFTASVHATLPGVPGLQRAFLLRPDREARPYLAVLEFEDEATYAAYMSSAAFDAAHGPREEPLADDHRVTNYYTVAQIGG